MIFYMLNEAHPSDYEARSLSVSDVVEFNNAEYWFCDSCGWQFIDNMEHYRGECLKGHPQHCYTDNKGARDLTCRKKFQEDYCKDQVRWF